MPNIYLEKIAETKEKKKSHAATGASIGVGGTLLHHHKKYTFRHSRPGNLKLLAAGAVGAAAGSLIKKDSKDKDE